MFKIFKKKEKKKKSSIVSREYRIFIEEEKEKRKKNFYERACEVAEKILKVEPDKATKEKLEEAIRVTGLKITPSGSTSLAILFFILMILLSSFIALLSFVLGLGIGLNYLLLFLLISLGITYYLYTYPITYKRKFLTRVGSEIPFLILYMVVYLRESPNMEGALSFASRNLSGPLANDIRKILWDVEVGKYSNVDEALLDYLSKWKEERFIVEAFQALRSSLQQTEKRRMELLDEAVRITLEGVREKARHYSEELKMPILLIHALGILLPVIGLVLFPILGIFLQVKSTLLFVGYDVILPFFLYFFISDLLNRRPTTFSEIRPIHHPDMPPEGKFTLKIGNRKYLLPILPFSILLATPLVVLGSYLTLKAGRNNLLPSLLITLGLLAGFISYFYLSSSKRIALRKEVRRTESEFTEALFQLGNQLASGVPLEVAIEKLTKRMSGLSIRRFFLLILRNIKRLGMTFRRAVFDPEYGAILFYPSKLIESIMKTIADAAVKGVHTAASTMLSISRYLRNIHETQERIRELLEDVLTSLRFQAYLLTPIVSGVIVTLATIIINIINQISTSVSSINATGSYLAPTFIMPWGELGITQGEFQIIAAIYFIETSIIIGMLISGIENGEDKIGRDYLTFNILWIGTIIYFLTLGITLMIFGPLAILKG